MPLWFRATVSSNFEGSKGTSTRGTAAGSQVEFPGAQDEDEGEKFKQEHPNATRAVHPDAAALSAYENSV